MCIQNNQGSNNASIYLEGSLHARAHVGQDGARRHQEDLLHVGIDVDSL